MLSMIVAPETRVHATLVSASPSCAPGAVHLDCNLAAIVAGTYSPRSITAIRVGTLNGG